MPFHASIDHSSYFMNALLQALECVVNGAQAVVECAGKAVY
jgi:hypothetical protein